MHCWRPTPTLIGSRSRVTSSRASSTCSSASGPWSCWTRLTRAYGGKGAGEFVQSVNRINPQVVIELSATPNHNISNLLVDISGVDLKKEQMIKLPVEVTAGEGEWRDTLGRAHDKLQDLTAAAELLQADKSRYVRPIAVVRVERTGKDQRDAGRIHAEDVRDHLVDHLGEAPEAVRVKSAADDEIAGEDLLSEYSQVRWIITKAALMEGWDCPFAYVLVMLDNTSSKTAITQLMGRVMRQPHARRTEIPDLDKSYVFCWQTAVDEAVTQVKAGLEREGMTGLGHDVVGSDAVDVEIQTIRRRKQFRQRDIFLPKVLHRQRDEWCDLSYQRHILPCVAWDKIMPPSAIPERQTSSGVYERTASVDVGRDDASAETSVVLEVDPTIIFNWMVRQLTDIIPNAWQAARIVKQFLESLSASGLSEEAIYVQRRELMILLRDHVIDEIERHAEKAFKKKLCDGEIRFDLEASEPNFKMHEHFELPVSAKDHSLQRAGNPVQKSLFDPVFDSEFDSNLEKNFAFYVDQQEAIQWWHRVAVRQQHEYYLRGWKQDRIWPDFVAMAEPGDGQVRLLVVETKGGHLKDNPGHHLQDEGLRDPGGRPQSRRHYRVWRGQHRRRTGQRPLQDRVPRGELRRGDGVSNQGGAMELAPDSILLTDRVAVVTGGGRGIGAATAVALARFGADVAFFDKESILVPGVAEQVEATGRRCVSEVLDGRDDDAVAAFMKRVHDELGPIDVLVNNAGGTFQARFSDVSARGEHTLIRENFSTVTNCVRHGIDLMSDGGSIINLTSVEAFHAAPRYGVYAAMKAAVQQFSKTLAVEYGHRGIRVNCVAPDMMHTPGDAVLAEQASSLEEDLYFATPLRRTGVADECAAVIVFLASDMASFVNGATILVDGGTVAAGNWKTRLDGTFAL